MSSQTNISSSNSSDKMASFPKPEYNEVKSVRIVPYEIVFENVFEGDHRCVYFSLQNVGKNPVIVKIGAPHSCAFRLNRTLAASSLAPGLRIIRKLTYINMQHSCQHSMLDIYIDGKYVSYGIYVLKAAPLLSVDPLFLDFGVLDVASSAVVRGFTLTNIGALGTKFTVDLGRNEMNLIVRPNKGHVLAYSSISVSVELFAVHEGDFYHEFWIVSKNGGDMMCIPVKGLVILPHLQVNHPNTTGDFTLINFEPSYVGTVHHHTMTVSNVSGQICTFLLMAEFEDALYPLVDGFQLDKGFLNFSIEPTSGRIQPSESRIFTITFTPGLLKKRPKKGWTHLMETENSGSTLVFVRILRVQCMDISEIEQSIEHFLRMDDPKKSRVSGSHVLATSKSSDSSTEPITSPSRVEKPTTVGPVVRLCLHGESVEPNIELQPNAVDFGTLEIGFVQTRVVRIKNPSPLLSIYFRYKKLVCVEMFPAKGALKPLESVEVILTYKPVSFGKVHQDVIIEMLDVRNPNEEGSPLVVIGTTKLGISCESPCFTTKRTPKFNLGISPQGTVHEVGKSTDEVTFKSGIVKPRKVMLQCDDGRRTWAVKPKEVPTKTEQERTLSKTARSISRVSERKIFGYRKYVADVKKQRLNERATVEVEKTTLIPSLNYPIIESRVPQGKWEKLSGERYRFILDKPAEPLFQESLSTKAAVGREITPNVRICKQGSVSKMPDSDVLIAFPNDRQRSNRGWTNPIPCKAIFSGLDRYSQPPDPSNTYTKTEIAARRRHDMTYTNFTRSTAQTLKSQQLKVVYYEDDLSCEHQNTFSRMRAPKPIEIKKSITSKVYSDEVLVPLTPQQLCNVKVTPYMINFGMVATFSQTAYTVHFENKNSFAVKIRIEPRRTGVTMPGGSTKILPAYCKSTMDVVYNAELLGRYHGYIDYVINDNHSFEVTLMADVVEKTVYLDKEDIFFGKTPAREAFHPKCLSVGITNLLPTATRFEWEVPEHSSFIPKPTSGYVGAKCKSLCEIMYTPNTVEPLHSELLLRSESGIAQLLKCSVVPRVSKVYFVNAKLNVENIPLNLPTTSKMLMHNPHYDDVTFKVKNPFPMSGCEVYPTGGVIKARSFKTLNLMMQIGAMVTFSFQVNVFVQGVTRLMVDVKGNVVYPKIKITPNALRLRRISADSFDTVKLTIENLGKADSEVYFHLKDYPEYHISLSPLRRLPFLKERLTLRAGKAQELYLHFYPVDVATYNFLLPMVINGILGPPNIDIKETLSPRHYLTQNEKDLQPYVVPTTIDLVPKLLETVRIDCTVAGHTLTFSKLEFKFDLVPDVDISFNTSIGESFRVTNEHKYATTSFCLSIDIDSSPFEVTYHKGKHSEETSRGIETTLRPSEYVAFKIKFIPKEPGTYEVDVPIVVYAHETRSIFNYLMFTGTYSHTAIVPIISEIFFLPVSLDVELQRSLLIECRHYTSDATLSAVVTPAKRGKEELRLDDILKVTYPNGNIIHPHQTHSVLPIMITFRSTISVAFTASIHLSDSQGASAIITVTAQAENSMLTTHASRHDRIAVKSDHSLRRKFDGMDHSGSYGHSDGNSPRSSSRRGSSSRIRDTSLNFDSLASKNSANAQSPILDISHDSNVLQDIIRGIMATSQNTLNETVIIDSSKSLMSLVSSDEYKQLFLNVYYYPKFPASWDDTHFARHMNMTLHAAEQWLYEQGFRCELAVSIPDGLTAMYSDLPNEGGKKKKSSDKLMKTYQDLLVNLAGPTVLKSFTSLSPPESNLERVEQVHQQHAELLTFLHRLGAPMPHISPKYLFSYEDYAVYMKRKCPEQPQDAEPNPPHYDIDHRMDADCPLCVLLIPEPAFRKLCTQAWLDVVLQTYKTLSLAKITLDTIGESVSEDGRVKVKHSVNINPSKSDLMKEVILTEFNRKLMNLSDTNVLSEPESILLSWLTAHYNTQRYKLWGPQQTREEDYRLRSARNSFDSASEHTNSQRFQRIPGERTITNFDADLADGVVLAAVTAAYCPYLVPQYLMDLYSHPRTMEENYHNCARLTDAWYSVRLGFTVCPNDIVGPNAVLLQMLTTTLFHVLPSLSPTATINFCTTLTSDVTREVLLTNDSYGAVTYTAIAIGDAQNFFSLEKPANSIYITIPARGKTTISIKYKARKIGIVTATLLLCGATVSPHFARSIVFSLEGEPTTLTTSDTINISAPLYKPLFFDLQIKPPYPDAAVYEIWLSLVEPTNSKEFEGRPWQEFRRRKVPRRLFLNIDTLARNVGEPTARLPVSVACLNPNKRLYWLIFIHPDIGDFIVHVTITPRCTEIMATIALVLPETLCICPPMWKTRHLGMEECPCRAQVRIPCRSAELWNAVKTMFEMALSEQERAFWSKHLETNIGLRLIQWLLGCATDCVAFEFNTIFLTSGTYTVKCSSPNVLVPETLTIPDFRLTSTVAMPLHVNQATPRPFAVTLTLTSQNGREIRNYKLSIQDH